MKEKKHIISFSGQSGPDVIMYQYSVKEGNNSVAAYYQDDEIVVESGTEKEITKKFNELNKQYATRDGILNACLLGFPLLFIAWDIYLIAVRHNILWLLGAIAFEVPAYQSLCGLIHSLTLKMYYYKSETDLHRFLKCHGAEHKALNAYTLHSRTGDIAAAAKASRLHFECGCVDAAHNILIAAGIGCSIALWPQMGLLTAILLPPALFLTCIILVLGNASPFKVIEFLITEEPDERELKLAIAALSQILANLADGSCPCRDYDQKNLDWYIENIVQQQA